MVQCYVPWLIVQMEDAKLARLAAEAFSALTGLDLTSADLQRESPEGLEIGPNDDPNDSLVAMDQDEGLPWPDSAKVDAWWKANGAGFTPGCRYFMGEPPDREKCLQVLKTGRQRQRRAAAEHATLLDPEAQLFNVFAPGWRQQRMLAARS